MNKGMYEPVYSVFKEANYLSRNDIQVLSSYDFIYGGDVLTSDLLWEKKVNEIIQFRNDFGMEKMIIEIRKKIS